MDPGKDPVPEYLLALQPARGKAQGWGGELVLKKGLVSDRVRGVE